MKNSKIDNLLESLDAIAAYHNSYEYGLPLYDESVVEEMRNCVLEWINNNNKEYKMEITLPNKRVILVNDESKERFMDKVVHCDSGCWVWAAARTRGSYGNFSVKVKTNGVFRYKMLRAHIYSCAVFNGVPESVLNTDENIVVMHTCDVPYCVSPYHLKFATAQENVDDSVRKNRHTKGNKSVPKSLKENINSRVLSEDTVREIRKLYADGMTNQRDIARKLDIHFANVCRVLKGDTWSWVGKGE